MFLSDRIPFFSTDDKLYSETDKQESFKSTNATKIEFYAPLYRIVTGIVLGGKQIRVVYFEINPFFLYIFYLSVVDVIGTYTYLYTYAYRHG